MLHQFAGTKQRPAANRYIITRDATSTFLEREDFDRLTDEERIDFLIEYAVPWYFQFVASWQRAEREGRLVVHWITYEEMLTDKAGAIGRLLAFHGMSLQREDIERSVADLESNERENRFNKGIAGRGQAGLTSSQRERITRLGRYYGKTDFGCLGL